MRLDAEDDQIARPIWIDPQRGYNPVEMTERFGSGQRTLDIELAEVLSFD